jgi:citronellol/citronellal dehydrogenase
VRALITGAARAIGAATAQILTERGFEVVATARRPELLADVPAALRLPLDVTDDESVRACMAEAGPIDVLVNNAAWTWFAGVAQFPVDQWLRSFAINVHAPMVLSQCVLADMIPRRSGAIVNISSGSARGPGRGPYHKPPVLRDGVLYGTEKAALERFSQGLAEELYPHGITVAALSPSQVVVTAGVIFHESVFDRDDEHTEPPEMMGRAVALLASEPLDRVTGRVCYSQQILQEFGWIDRGRGTGIDTQGSGYSQM